MDKAKADPHAAPEGKSRSESFREKAGAALTGFILTGVVGTMVATWFQQRGWAWQNRVMQVEKDTARALDSLQSASNLLNRRWSATLQKLQSLQDAKAAEDPKAAGEAFSAVAREWEVGYANIVSAVKFNIDRPFGVDAKRIPDLLWTQGCDAFPFGGAAAGGLDANSAHVILTVIDHCHGLIKNDIDGFGTAPAAGVDARLAPSFLRLSHIYYLNDALRCVILERAIAMRNSLDRELGWGSIFQIAAQTYEPPPRESDCLEPYRAWATKTAPKLP